MAEQQSVGATLEIAGGIALGFATAAGRCCSIAATRAATRCGPGCLSTLQRSHEGLDTTFLFRVGGDGPCLLQARQRGLAVAHAVLHQAEIEPGLHEARCFLGDLAVCVARLFASVLEEQRRAEVGAYGRVVGVDLEVTIEEFFGARELPGVVLQVAVHADGFGRVGVELEHVAQGLPGLVDVRRIDQACAVARAGQYQPGLEVVGAGLGCLRKPIEHARYFFGQFHHRVVGRGEVERGG